MVFQLKADPSLRVGLVHDWLTGMRGGEKCLELLCRLFPQAEIFTLLHKPGSCPSITHGRKVHTSWLDDLPGVETYYRHLLPLMPGAIEAMDVSHCDLVISTNHCVAKGIGGLRPEQARICYCFSPIRYVWALPEDYDKRMGLSGWGLKAMRPFLRSWDRRTACRVDQFVANSRYISRRIERAYHRAGKVVYSPVDTDFYTPDASVKREEFYLVVSAMSPYKKVDQAVEAFAQMPRRRLKIVGTGQMLSSIRERASDNVEILGWRTNEEIRDLLRRCRALLFPPLEDFGIVPLEAAACGAPVIAYAKGGALETVRGVDRGQENPTGLLYEPQTAAGLAEAIARFEALDVRFDPRAMQAWARRFSPENFLRGMVQVVSEWLAIRSLPGFVEA
jgi:glycosyltransferase involved in cell wall biosynthesis